MKGSVPTPVVIGVVVAIVGLVAWFGFRQISGGPNGDITESTNAHYRQIKNSAGRADPQAQRNAPPPPALNGK